MWLAKQIFKWVVLVALWVASIIFVTTNALLMDVISDNLTEVFDVTTPYAQQKQRNLKQKPKSKNKKLRSRSKTLLSRGRKRPLKRREENPRSWRQRLLREM